MCVYIWNTIHVMTLCMGISYDVMWKECIIRLGNAASCVWVTQYTCYITCETEWRVSLKMGKKWWYRGSDLRLSIMFPSTSTRWGVALSSSCCSHVTQCLWGHPTTLLTLPTSFSWSRDSRTGEEAIMTMFVHQHHLTEFTNSDVMC